MRIKTALVALFVALAGPAFAQATKATITAEVNSNLPTNGDGQIDAAILRTTLIDFINASNFQADFILVSQMPAMTGDCTTVAGTVDLLCTKTNGNPFTPWAYGANGTSTNAVGTGFDTNSQALFLNGTYTGEGVGPFALISVSDTGGAATNGFRSGLWVAHNVGAGASEGSRSAILPILTIANPIPCTTGTYCFHTAVFPQTYVSANLGGTVGTYKGDVYGVAALAQLQSGATYINGVTNEFDVAVQTGASINYKSIASFVAVNYDAVGGALHNAMVVFTADNTTTYKWPKGITFGRSDSTWPFDTSSNIIDSSTPGTGSRVALNGVDFSDVTFSGCAFKSNGFCVKQDGSITSVLTSNLQSGTTYTLQQTDCGNVVQINNASNITVTLPSNLSITCAVLLVQTGAGYISFSPSPSNAHGYTKTYGVNAAVTVMNGIGGVASSWAMFGDAQ